jgi:hypothetical protein
VQKKMPSHRTFEMLVARIEGLLGQGAIIKSPDHIADLSTGTLREVDASIRYKVGSVDTLMTVECRERSNAQDVQWIEQLATKKANIGAMHTIAVSAKGFSAEAEAKAKTLGISTRRLQDVADKDIKAWPSTLEVTEVEKSITLAQMSLSWYDASTKPDLEEATAAAWKDAAWELKIFVDAKTGAELSVEDLIARIPGPPAPEPPAGSEVFRAEVRPKEHLRIAPHNPLMVLTRDLEDGETKWFYLKFDRGELLSQTRQGPLFLELLALRLVASTKERPVGTDRVVEYSGDGQTIAVITERRVKLGKEEFIITAHERSERVNSDRAFIKARKIKGRPVRVGPPKAIKGGRRRR